MYALFLCGPPGCGKTTYAMEHLPADFQYLSTDFFIKREAHRTGVPVDQIFQTYYPTAEELFQAQLSHCNSAGKSFIVDRTNTTELSRKLKLKKVNPSSFKIAIYFPAYTVAVLRARIDKRVKGGGHDVQQEDLERFHNDYRIPSKNEGFDLVIGAHHFLDVLKGMEFKL